MSSNGSSEYSAASVRHDGMTLRTFITAAFCLLAGTGAAQQPVEITEPGSYVLLLDDAGKPFAGSYRISGDVKMAVQTKPGSGFGDAIYVDREFLPRREAEMLSFFNGKYAYSVDPLKTAIGDTVAVIRHETRLPPLFKDSIIEVSTPIKVSMNGVVAATIGNTKLVKRLYRIEKAGDQDAMIGWGDRVYLETLDTDLSAEAAGRIASIETGKAASSGDFLVLYTIKADTVPEFTACLLQQRQTPGYAELARRQHDGPDAFMASRFIAQGQVFWQDKDLSETNFAMSAYQLCPR